MTAGEIEQRLAADLARYLELPADREAVSVASVHEGRVERLRIDLTGARLDPERVLGLEGATERPPDLVVERLELLARPLLVQGAGVWLEGEAEGAGLALVGGPPRFVGLRQGEIRGRVGRRELETAVRSLATDIAGRYGVSVEEVRIALEQPHERSLAGRASVRAGRRVLLATVRAAIEVAGRLEVVPGAGLALRDVSAHGEGPLGAMVSGLLAPRLERLAGAVLSLPVLPGRIVDASFALGDNVEMRALLGS